MNDNHKINHSNHEGTEIGSFHINRTAYFIYGLKDLLLIYFVYLVLSIKKYLISG